MEFQFFKSKESIYSPDYVLFFMIVFISLLS